MADVNFALAQLNLGNSVQRIGIPGVYLKRTQITPSFGPIVMFNFSDDSPVISLNTGYEFDLDDASATDWELYSATGTQKGEINE